jgi:hypothetical protein
LTFDFPLPFAYPFFAACDEGIEAKPFKGKTSQEKYQTRACLVNPFDGSPFITTRDSKTI